MVVLMVAVEVVGVYLEVTILEVVDIEHVRTNKNLVGIILHNVQMHHSVSYHEKVKNLVYVKITLGVEQEQDASII